MYRLGACIPILGFFFFLFKSLKMMRIYDYVIFSINTFKIYVLIWKKGISKLLRQVAPKHTAITVVNNLFAVSSCEFWRIISKKLWDLDFSIQQHSHRHKTFSRNSRNLCIFRWLSGSEYVSDFVVTRFLQFTEPPYCTKHVKKSWFTQI